MIQRVEQHLVVREENMQVTRDGPLVSLREQVEQLGAAAPVPMPLNIIPKTSSQFGGELVGRGVAAQKKENHQRCPTSLVSHPLREKKGLLISGTSRSRAT